MWIQPAWLIWREVVGNRIKCLVQCGWIGLWQGGFAVLPVAQQVPTVERFSHQYCALIAVPVPFGKHQYVGNRRAGGAQCGHRGVFAFEGEALAEACIGRDVEVVLLDFQEDGLVFIFGCLRVEHDAGDATPATTAFVGCFKPFEIAFDDGFDVEQSGCIEWVAPLFTKVQGFCF